MKKYIAPLFLVVALIFPFSAHADFYVGGWNLESGDSDEEYLAQEVQKWPGIGVWGFSEVRDEAVLVKMRAGLNEANSRANFTGAIGTTGRGDRLAILFDQNLFTHIAFYELQEINVGGTLRAPLVGHLRENATGQEFLFVVNHFYRGKGSEEARRDKQSALFRAWIEQQTLPVIAVGDYNFDCELPELNHCNNSFNVLTTGGVVSWVRPENPIRTQCNRRFNSILDFVFVNNQAGAWSAGSWVLNPEYEACDDNAQKTDHRPVAGMFVTN